MHGTERRRICRTEKHHGWLLFSETLSPREKHNIRMDGSCSVAPNSSRLWFAAMMGDILGLCAKKQRSQGN